MFTALIVIFVFSLVVVMHEMGHFLVARFSGVRVEKFAIGFGKEIFGFDWKGTRWSFCLLPLGGYVKPAGEDLEEVTGAQDEFFAKPWYVRSAIALAGPVMNYVLALLCFFAILFFWGEVAPSTQPVVGEVVAGYPAQAAGVLVGDKIVAVNGNLIKNWEEVSALIHQSPNVPLDLKIERKQNEAESTFILAIVPKKDEQRGVGLIGISPRVEYVPQSFSKAVVGAWDKTVLWTQLTLNYLGHTIRERKKPEISGPIGIVSIVAKVSQQGLMELISLIALISLSLGLFNIFPIPILDGGHILMYLIEGISRRPLNRKIMNFANVLGMAVLLMIFVFATSQDLMRLKDSFWR